MNLAITPPSDRAIRAFGRAQTCIQLFVTTCAGILCPLAVAAEDSGGGLARALDSLARPLVLEPSPVEAAVLNEEAELERLEHLPAVRIPVQEAALGSAVNLVAAAAGMNFIAPPPEEFPETVSLFVTGNPWHLLRKLSTQYRFTMSYGGGVWLFRREAAGALVGVTYELRHGNLDTYEATQNSVSSVGSSGETGDSGGGSVGGGLVFTPKSDRIVADLRELLGIPQGGTEAIVVSGAAKQVEPVAEAAPIPVPARAGGAGAPPADGARVVHLPDSNTLLVVATRSQHEYVRAYLDSLDRPARQVRIEARFVETSHDPSLVLGIDPSGFQPKLSLSELTSRVDLNRLGSLRLPQQALLSADTVALQLNALRTDERSSIVNQPTVTTSENREVYLSVGTEEPFAASSLTNTSASSAALGTSQSSVAFRRVGTTINLIPTVFPGTPGARPLIRLTVQIEVGALAGFRRINDSDVPRVQSQRYCFTVMVPAGETLAFGGLSGASETTGERGVPGLSRIPLAGALFRSRSRTASQRNLVAYITPSLVGDTAATPKTPAATPLSPPAQPPPPAEGDDGAGETFTRPG